jgi:hypothetical protein
MRGNGRISDHPKLPDRVRAHIPPEPRVLVPVPVVVQTGLVVVVLAGKRMLKSLPLPRVLAICAAPLGLVG